MRVLKEEVFNGSLHKLNFLSEGESMDELKQSIKSWMKANHPEIGWEDFFTRVVRLDRNSVELNME